MRQQERVLNYMQAYGSISSLEAFRDLGVTRLSAVIFKLQHNRGVTISKKVETAKNRYGESVHFTRYSLGGEYGKA